MRTVVECDVLEMGYEQYSMQPNWWIDLMLKKRSIDSEHAKKKSSKD
jgi:hypothetical protein